MKFTTAVAILLQTVHSSTASDENNRLLFFDGTNKNKNNNNNVRRLLQQGGGFGGGMMQQRSLYQQQQQQRREASAAAAGGGGRHGRRLQMQLQPQGQVMPLSNVNDYGGGLQQRQYVQMQMPGPVTPMNECEPDLGILACGGLHEYCITSSRSTMGGYCMDFAPSEGVGRKTRFLEDAGDDDDEEMMDDGDDTDGNNNNNNNNGYSSVIGSGVSSSCYCTYYGPNITNRWENAYYSYCARNDTFQDCSCSNVNREAYTLTAECKASESYNCYQTYSLCNVNYTRCAYWSNSIEIKERDKFTAERCFQRSDTTICYGTDIEIVSRNTTGNYNYNLYSAEACSIKINGVTCNSCDVVERSVQGYCAYPLYDASGKIDPYFNCTSNFTIQCYDFDCTNTDWDRKGSTCDPVYGPYGYASYGCDTSCKVCGDDAIMSSPDTVLEIPFLGKITCNESQNRASIGFLTTEGCLALEEFAYDKCGCEVGGGGSGRDGNLKRASQEATNNNSSGSSRGGGGGTLRAGLASSAAAVVTWFLLTVLA